MSDVGMNTTLLFTGSQVTQVSDVGVNIVLLLTHLTQSHFCHIIIYS